jgi:hypothetical protein
MYGDRPASVFLVYANPGPHGPEALAAWYMEIHGPDSILDGTFSALYRYEAAGDYPARFLALWEGPFTSADQARGQILPRARARKGEGRVSASQEGIWTDMYFLHGPASVEDGVPEVVTMTVLEGGNPLSDEETAMVLGTGGRRYDYLGLTFFESPDPLEVVAARWSGRASEGMAPHGPYRNLFADPDTFLQRHPEFPERWASHWGPIASMRAADLAKRR